MSATLALPYEDEAQEIARRNGYDIHTLSYLYGRYQFGSLAESLGAANDRDVYWRALLIAYGHANERDRRNTAPMGAVLKMIGAAR